MADLSKHVPPEIIRLEYDHLVKETGKAWLLNFGDDKKGNAIEVWCAKSICQIGEDPDGLSTTLVDMPDWFYNKHLKGK